MAIHTRIDSRQLEINFVSKPAIASCEISQTKNIIDMERERTKMQLDREESIKTQLLDSLLTDARKLNW